MIVYEFSVWLYVATYVASPTTSLTSGDQVLNVYVYCAVADFVGVSPSYEGIVPYSTFSSVSKIDSSAFFHNTVYLRTTGSKVAVYVTFPVTLLISGVQDLNTYEYWAVDALVGVSPSYVGVCPYATLSSTSKTDSS